MGEAEAATISVVGVNPYLATEALDDELTDGEPKSASLCLFVELLEPGEYLLLLCQRDAAAGILHGEERFVCGGEAEREVDVFVGGKNGGVD